jgi:hypothetical protein
MAENYGSGYAKFTDGSARQVLELGKKVHYFNPSDTPIFSIMGRTSTRSTPVPKFEWMEDEHFIKRSIKLVGAAGTIGGTAIGSGLIDGGVVVATADSQQFKGRIDVPRQAQLELFEIAGVYKVTTNHSGGTVNNVSAVTSQYVMCVSMGVDSSVDGTDRTVVFESVGYAVGVVTLKDAHAGGVFASGGSSTVWDFEYVATAGKAASGAALHGYEYQSGGAIAYSAATWTAHGPALGYNEGAGVNAMSSKKVRRLSNYTQIFREPFSLTRTMRVSKQYGEQEFARLQARKLTKIKGDLEWALMMNGAAVPDASAMNPKRTFMGFGLSGSGGAIKSNDGRSNSDFQFDIDNDSYDIDELDKICANLFADTINGSMSKVALCSNKWLRELVKAVRKSSGATVNAEMGSGVTSGMRVTKHYGPVGELQFIPHPLLNGAYEDYALVIDPANIDMRPLAQSDMQLRNDIVKDGTDGTVSEWLYEGGPEIRNEQTHAILKMTF